MYGQTSDNDNADFDDNNTNDETWTPIFQQPLTPRYIQQYSNAL